MQLIVSAPDEYIYERIFAYYSYSQQYELSLYGTEFIQDKVYTGQSLYGTKFIRGQILYGDKVNTGTKFIRDKVYMRTKFIQTFFKLYLN